MAVSHKLYAKFPLNAAGGDAGGDGPMDLLSDVIKHTLHTGTYAPNQSTDETKSNATNELATAGGYTALGNTLGTKTYASSSLVTTFDAADSSWTSFTNTFRYGVIWDDNPTAPADPLISYIDTGGDQTLNGTERSLYVAPTRPASQTGSHRPLVTRVEGRAFTHAALGESGSPTATETYNF